MSGGKGGSQSSQVQIPAYMEDALKQQIARAQAVQSMPYAPIMGPTMAGFTSGQKAGMESQAALAQRMGIIPQSYDVTAGYMPSATDVGGGLSAYSSYPGAKERVLAAFEENPELRRQYEGLYAPQPTYQETMAGIAADRAAANAPRGTLDVISSGDNGADNQGGYQPPGYDMPYSESLRGIGFGAMNIPNPVIARIGQEVYQGQLDAEKRGMTSGDFGNRSYDDDYSGSNVGMTGWSE